MIQLEPATDRQVGGDHYRIMSIQPWDAIAAWAPDELTPFQGFLYGNLIKYAARAGRKGALIEDLKKAQHYTQRLLEDLENP